MVERLFIRLEAIYTARWRTSADTPDVAKAMKEAWCEAMDGIDTRRVKGALSKLHLATDGWPPTPGQFRAMCMPTAEDLGLPDRETAWKQVCGNAPITSPVVWRVRERIGSWDLKHMPAAATRPRFDREWALAVDQAATGQQFEWPKGADPALAIEDTRGKAGRRGPTAASELALDEIRKKWGRAPDAATPSVPQKDSPVAEAALKEVRERLLQPPIQPDQALRKPAEPVDQTAQPDASPNIPQIAESDVDEYLQAWSRAPDVANSAAVCDIREEK